jgi:hypothetical protein
LNNRSARRLNSATFLVTESGLAFELLGALERRGGVTEPDTLQIRLPSDVRGGTQRA